ncbi:MAG: CAP domain-containing protein [Planctomycetales bacterium]|nr:CAP domain-containing protein [Planctomycetales bacterium]
MGTVRNVSFALALVAGLAGAVRIAPAQEGATTPAPPDPEVTKLLDTVRRAKTPGARAEAVRSLRDRGGEAAERLRKALADLEADRRRRVEGALLRVRALARGPEENPGLAKLRIEWGGLRDHANAWLFDAVKFPPPRKQPVTGPEIGYDVAKAREDAARKAYEALEPFLDEAAAAALATPPARARKLREDLAAALAAHVECASYLGKDTILPLPDLAADERFFLALAEEDWTAAVAEYKSLPAGWRKLCAFHAYGRSIVAWNARNPCGMDKQEARGIESINRIRPALGISPLRHNEKLYRAAKKHSEEMVAMGYFDHFSPVEANKDPQKRASNEGYKAEVTECCSSLGTQSSAVEMWKWDGGHHRAMIEPDWTEAGAGSKGYSTFVPGAGEEGSPPGIRY